MGPLLMIVILATVCQSALQQFYHPWYVQESNRPPKYALEPRAFFGWIGNTVAKAVKTANAVGKSAADNSRIIGKDIDRGFGHFIRGGLHVLNTGVKGIADILHGGVDDFILQNTSFDTE